MDLPPCHSGRSFAGEAAVFFCAHPNHHSQENLVSPEVCGVCPLWRQPPPPAFRQAPAALPPRRDGPCRFLGDETGLRECPSCSGSVRLRVFECSHPHHQETTLRECASCPGFETR